MSTKKFFVNLHQGQRGMKIHDHLLLLQWAAIAAKKPKRAVARGQEPHRQYHRHHHSNYHPRPTQDYVTVTDPGHQVQAEPEVIVVRGHPHQAVGHVPEVLVEDPQPGSCLWGKWCQRHYLTTAKNFSTSGMYLSIISFFKCCMVAQWATKKFWAQKNIFLKNWHHSYLVI